MFLFHFQSVQIIVIAEAKCLKHSEGGYREKLYANYDEQKEKVVFT